MASILKFIARSDSVRERAPAGSEQKFECQIIIFPGVRYERWSGGDAPKPEPKGGKRRRARQR